MKTFKFTMIFALVSVFSMSAFALDPRTMTCKQVRKAVAASGDNGVWMRIGFWQHALVKHPKYECPPGDYYGVEVYVQTADKAECDAGFYCAFDVPNTGVIE